MGAGHDVAAVAAHQPEFGGAQRRTGLVPGVWGGIHRVRWRSGLRLHGDKVWLWFLAARVGFNIQAVEVNTNWEGIFWTPMIPIGILFIGHMEQE